MRHKGAAAVPRKDAGEAVGPSTVEASKGLLEVTPTPGAVDRTGPRGALGQRGGTQGVLGPPAPASR